MKKLLEVLLMTGGRLSKTKATALVAGIINILYQFELFPTTKIEAINAVLLAFIAIFMRDGMDTPSEEEPAG